MTLRFVANNNAAEKSSSLFLLYSLKGRRGKQHDTLDGYVYANQKITPYNIQVSTRRNSLVALRFMTFISMYMLVSKKKHIYFILIILVKCNKQTFENATSLKQMNLSEKGQAFAFVAWLFSIKNYYLFPWLPLSSYSNSSIYAVVFTQHTVQYSRYFWW